MTDPLNKQTEEHLIKVLLIYHQLLEGYRSGMVSDYVVPMEQQQVAATLTLAVVQSETAEQVMYASLEASRTASEVQRMAGV